MPKKPTNKAKAKEEAKNIAQSPWHAIQFRGKRLLADVKSLRELFEIVIPILAEKDKQRQTELHETVDGLDEVLARYKKSRGPKKNSEMHDLVTKAKKTVAIAMSLRSADSIFRSNTLAALVTSFENYEAELIRSALKAFPARLNASDKTISYAEALTLGSTEEVRDALVSLEIDKIMRQSERDQFKYLEGLASFDFRKNLDIWPMYVELVERRNVHTHCAGKISKQYLEVCRAEKVVLDANLKVGAPLAVTDDYFHAATNTLCELAVVISDVMVRRLFPAELAFADSGLLEMAYSYEVSEEWSLARRLFNYAVNLPVKSVSSDEFKKVFLINKAICAKASGDADECKKLIDGIDWSAANPKYLLATQVLMEDYKAAEETMSRFSKKGPLEEWNCSEWPLFRDFRNTPEFKRAYKRAFGKDFDRITPAIAAAEQQKIIPLLATSSTNEGQPSPSE